MSKTINILSVIDVETILNDNLKKGTKQNPTSLGSFADSDKYVYMITARGFIDNDDITRADSELTIDANVGDTVQWELTCPGSGLQHDAIISNVVLGSQPTPSLTEPKPVIINRHIYTQAGSPGYQVVQQTDFTSNVIAIGTVQYYITFQIMDHLGNDLGYYLWDPFVKVLDTPTFQKERAAYLEKKKALIA